MRNLMSIEMAKCRGGYEDQPPDTVYGGGWAVQPKLDGIRKSCQIGKKKVWLVSRSREDKLKGVEAAGDFVGRSNWGWVPDLLGLGEEGTMLDGELCSLKEGVRQAMHYWSEAPGKLHYVVFDCLFRHGKDVRHEPYTVRFEQAAQAVKKLAYRNVILIESVVATEKAELAFVRRGEEGVIFTAFDGMYGDRKKRWKKKAQNPLDVVVTGCSEKMNGGSPKAGIKAKPTGRPAAAQVGMWVKGRLITVGWMMNLTDEDKALTMEQFNRKYTGKVARAVCSKWDGDGFTWVRFAGWHEDKRSKDCVLSEQIGEKALAEIEV